MKTRRIGQTALAVTEYSFGGASLPFRADITGRKFELRADLFDKDDEIADGVRLALVPLLNAR